MKSPGTAISFGALPSSLRPVVLTAVRSGRRLAITTLSRSLHQLTADSTSSSASLSSSLALSYLPGPSNVPNSPPAVPAPDPPEEALKAVDNLFLAKRRDKNKKILPAAQFLYSVPRFLQLPRNTVVPEVCLLGRSNVGKSTLINALAGMSADKAGQVHATKVRKRDGFGGLAVTSAEAGRTRTMNAYGFGHPPPPTPHTDKNKDPDSNGTGKLMTVGGRSRTAVREDSKARAKMAEKHRHSLVLMDMPGFGQNSEGQWGDEILKYLSRREQLRGAVLLIDAFSGMKLGDRAMLMLLAERGVRTAVVLTKADKALRSGAGEDEIWDSGRDMWVTGDKRWAGAAKLTAVMPGEGDDKGEADHVGEVPHKVRKTLVEVWRELERAEKVATLPKREWRWEREVFITSAGNSKLGGFGVSGIRWAIARLAGLVKEAEPTVTSSSDAGGISPEAPAPKIVPYSEIQVKAAPSPHLPSSEDFFTPVAEHGTTPQPTKGLSEYGSRPTIQSKKQLSNLLRNAELREETFGPARPPKISERKDTTLRRRSRRLAREMATLNEAEEKANEIKGKPTLGKIKKANPNLSGPMAALILASKQAIRPDRGPRARGPVTF